MDFQSIKNDEDYQQMLDWVDSQFDLNLVPDNKEGQQLQMALLLIKEYEDLHYAIPNVAS